MAEQNNQKGKNQEEQVQDLNQLRKVRREKLADLQAAGKDPFVITKFDVTHHTKDAAAEYETLESQHTSTQETNDHWKAKFTLFRRPVNWGEGGLMSKNQL